MIKFVSHYLNKKYCILILFFLALNTSLIGKDFSYQPSKFPQAKYSEFGYAWENNTIGFSSDVPPPWIDLTVKDKNVSVWGRTYSINQNNSLLERIQIQGEDILTSPIKLNGEINGEKINRNKVDSKVTENKKNIFKRKTIIKNKDFEITIDKSVEFDGFVRFDIYITPKTKITINNLQLEIPLKQNFAKYFSHFLSYDYAKQRSNRKNIFKSSGAINEPLIFRFTPTIWIGDNSRGIELINETNVNDYPNNNKEKSISISRVGNTASLKRHFISENITINKPLTYSVALIATPTKPKIKNWRNIYFSRTLQAEQAIKIPLNNECRDILYFGNFTSIPLQYPGLPIPSPRKNIDGYIRYKTERGILKKNNIQYIPYSALYILPSAIKELKDYQALWSTVPARKGAFYWTKKLGVKKPIQPVIYEHRSIRDYLIHVFISQIKKNDIDGVYFDAATISELKNITQYKFGKKLNAQYYPMYSHREILKRFWIATKYLKKEFKIIHHATKPPHFASAFSDIVATGEELNIHFKGKNNKTKVVQNKVVRVTNQNKYKPDYHEISETYYNSSLNQGDGYVAMLLPQVKKFNNEFLKENDDKYIEWTKNLVATSLKYDIPLWRTRIKQSLIDEIDRQIVASKCISDTQNSTLPIKLNPLKFTKQIEITSKATNSGDMIMSVYNDSSSQKKFSIVFRRSMKIIYDSTNTVVTTSDTSYQANNNKSISINLAKHDLLMFTLKVN